MKIIDAEWEKRNLGVSCYEIVIQENDLLSDIQHDYNSITEREYNVIKIPSSRFDLMEFFQNNNYRFIETAITLKHNLKNITISEKLKKLLDKCDFKPMDNNDIVYMNNEIDRNIFKTDRISIDPAFTQKQSSNRYKMWIQDLINQGQTPQKVIFQNSVVGFFINKDIGEGAFDGILAAVYSEYEGSGMGIIVQYMGLLSAVKRNAREYIGHISGNNPKILKVLTALGFEVTKLDYIFIKHC